MFVDTGLTVSFTEEQQTAADTATEVTADMAAPVTTVHGDGNIGTTLGFGQYYADLAQTATAYYTTATAGNMYIDNGFLGQMDIGQIVTRATRTAQEYHRKKAKPKKEEELNPGDTKALDDFLSGFMRSAT